MNKMNYEEFKETVKKRFTEFLPEEYKDAEIEIQKVAKVNQVLDALRILTPFTKRTFITPSIYINSMYERYLLENVDFNSTMEETANLYMEAMQEKDSMDLSFLNDTAKVKKKVVFQLINTEQNQEMIKNMPHRSFCDLTIIYRLIGAWGEDEGQTTFSIAIHNDLAERLSLNEEELFHLATENTKRLLPPVITTINEVVKKLFAEQGISSEEIEEIDMMMANQPPEMQMYVLTNHQNSNGAANILYEDLLYELAQKLDSDLYILPSSVHECILTSANMGDPYFLAKVVAEINLTEVELSERLSNQVYLYDKDLRKVTMTTDTPNKRLDGIVA